MDCHFEYLSPRPTEQAMRQFYESGDYYASQAQGEGYGNYADQQQSLRLTARALLTELQRLRRGARGRLLEVGCGLGYFLSEARPHFDWLEATEMSAAAAEQAKAFADRVFVGDVSSLPSGHQRYDVIVASQVVEHIYAPHSFVASLTQRLAPGGCLLLTTPDAGSPWRRLMGSKWPSFKLPEHVTYYDSASLQRLMGAHLPRVVQVPCEHAFPLALVFTKLGLGRWSARLGDAALFMPKACVTVAGFAQDE